MSLGLVVLVAGNVLLAWFFVVSLLRARNPKRPNPKLFFLDPANRFHGKSDRTIVRWSMIDAATSVAFLVFADVFLIVH